MGVYIKGMGMPKSGTYEVSIDNTNGRDKTVISMFVRGEGGFICCGVYEIVHVPPHGRLIGENDVRKLFDETDLRARGIYPNNVVALAPTIIPAEEGET